MVQITDRTAIAVESRLSLEEFLARPETQPASEFVGGRIDQKPMPQGEHSAIQSDLTALINQLRRDKIARAFPELRCTFGERAIVPDIAVFVWDRIARDEDGRVANRFDLAPDWAIEILSPNQSMLRPTKNLLHCLESGGELGWLIEPEEFSVLVYAPDAGTRYFDAPSDVLPVPEFARGLEITIEDLQGFLRD